MKYVNFLFFLIALVAARAEVDVSSVCDQALRTRVGAFNLALMSGNASDARTFFAGGNANGGILNDMNITSRLKISNVDYRDCIRVSISGYQNAFYLSGLAFKNTDNIQDVFLFTELWVLDETEWKYIPFVARNGVSITVGDLSTW